MESIFLKILNMSLTSAYVILVVLMVRLFLKRAPKRYSYYLWAAVGFRLACPVSIPSIFSLFNLNTVNIYPSRLYLNLREVPVYDATNTILPKPATGISTLNEIMEASPVFQPSWTSVNPIQIYLIVGAFLWICGMGVLILYSMLSYWNMKRKLSVAVCMKENIYESDRIVSPFILGLMKPHIYLPFGLEEETKKYVLAHEQYHLKRKDHIVKFLGWFLLVIHWFNPLVWLAFRLMNKDMEMSCDEQVLSAMENGKKDYSKALVSFAANRRFPTASPLAFGEAGVKARVKNILKWKRPKRMIAVAALILSAIVIGACVLNPYQNKDMTIGGLSGPLASRLYYQTEEEDLERAISEAVLGRESYYKSEMDSIYDVYWTESHIVMAKEEIKDQVTGRTAQVKMYLLVNTEEFTYTKVSMENTGGSYIPTIITFDVQEDGSYKEADYWIPRDGSYYVPDIRKAFPQDVAEDVIDHDQDYIEMLIQENYLKAIAHGEKAIGGFGWTPYHQIETLFETLLSSPKNSLDPIEHINEHYIEYRELKYYSFYTLRYSFEEFLNGERMDAKGYLMSEVCRDLIAAIGSDGLAIPKKVQGQEWFDAFVDQARKNWRVYEEEDLKIFCPASHLLYEMQKKEGSQYVKAMAAKLDLSVGDAWEEHQKLRAELNDENQEIRYQVVERTLLREDLGGELAQVDVKVVIAYLYGVRKEGVFEALGAYVLEENLNAPKDVLFEHGGYTAYLYESEVRISATGQIRKKGSPASDAKTWNVRIPMTELLLGK